MDAPGRTARRGRDGAPSAPPRRGSPTPADRTLARVGFTRTVEVVAVVDGDTIDVATGDGTARVRLIGIDTPEIGRGGDVSECYAEEARTFLDEMLHGRQVELVTDPSQADVDKYGRLLRHVVIDERSASELAIEAGAGFEYTYDAPYINQKANQAAQRVAEASGAGLWGVCS